MNTIMRSRISLRLLSLTLLVCLVLCCVLSCRDISEDDAMHIGFREMQTEGLMARLDGEAVMIYGYMTVNETVGAPSFFLTNYPYQSYPSEIEGAAAVEVVLRRGEVESIVCEAVKVIGRVQMAPEGQTFSDAYGNTYDFRIVDARYEPLDAEDCPYMVGLWQQIYRTGIIANVMDAFNYAHFACAWNTYTGRAANGTQFYLYPGDATASITEMGSQYYYGYSDGYFDRLFDKARLVEAEATEELVLLLRSIETLAADGLASLNGQNYTQTELSAQELASGFVGVKYELGNGEELLEAYVALFDDFSRWLTTFKVS